MGFMKQGVLLMTLFFGCMALSSWGLGIFGFAIPIIWFFSFFHVHNLAGLPDEEFYSMEDSFHVGEWKIYDVIGRERFRKYFAWVLILVGCSGVWQIVTGYVEEILNYYGISAEIWKSVMDNVPQLVFSVIITYIGVQMIKSKKRQLEEQEGENRDA